MKLILTIGIILFSVNCFSQPLNNIPKPDPRDVLKKDTIKIIQREVRDTIKADILFEDQNGFVKHTAGYVIRIGLTENGKQFIATPKIIGCLDDRRKEIKTWYRVL